VLVVPILAGASGKANVKPLTYFSALMALAGVGLLVEKGGVIMPNAGDLWSLASAVFFGVQVRDLSSLLYLGNCQNLQGLRAARIV
jgi:drug/metabolite transporter (DMT)-like permease